MANLNKEDLVVAIAGQGELSKAEAERQLVNVISGIKAVLNGMEAKDKLQLVGLLTFEVVEKPACTARNPKTGEAVNVPAQNKLKVKAGKQLVDIIQ